MAIHRLVITARRLVMRICLLVMDAHQATMAAELFAMHIHRFVMAAHRRGMRDSDLVIAAQRFMNSDERFTTGRREGSAEPPERPPLLIITHENRSFAMHKNIFFIAAKGGNW